MKIAIVTNIITPYRKRFYDELNIQISKRSGELKVFAMTDSLPLRPWTFEDLKSPYMELLPGKKFLLNTQDMDVLFNPSVNKRLKSYNPDFVIVAGSWTYPTTFLMLYNKLTNGAKYLFWTESHGVRGINALGKDGLRTKIKRKIIKKFDGFCIPGKYATEYVNALVGENHGFKIKLPNLVDNNFYREANILRKFKVQIKTKYKIPISKRVFITPARLILRKGIDIFLKNIKACELNKKAVFVLAGEGPLETIIKRIAYDNNLDVKIMGYCNQETIRELYALADVFFLPSLSDPNPLTVIEASFAGLPLFISKYIGNGPELCINHENGIIYDTNDQTSVEEAFTEIMKVSDEWLEKAGSMSLKIAMENFDCQNEVSKFISQLENC